MAFESGCGSGEEPTQTVKLEPVAKAVCKSKRLTFVRPVGAGAFKETFHVQGVTGQELALKVYQLGSSPQRTHRELKAMMRCAHPNIAKLADLFKFDWSGNSYLVSLEEFLPGGTLAERVRKGGLLSPPAVLDIGEPLIDAVGHIAALNLVHRDLKPENIAFREDGITPVILDFGLVRDLADSSLTATWMPQGPGTPLFSPPEQLLNEKYLIDWRSDQFSLGVLLSVCTFGFHPFSEPGLSDVEVVERVAQRQPQASRFYEVANAVGLPTLIRMTGVWPVERVRTPQELAYCWSAQKRG